MRTSIVGRSLSASSFRDELVVALSAATVALAGCASSLAVLPPGTAGSANVRDTGARPTPALLTRAIERDGTVRGLLDPGRGLVVVRAYTDEGDGEEVRTAVRQCAWARAQIDAARAAPCAD
jgi:hypothetical protein